jgi:hypothetical protein
VKWSVSENGLYSSPSSDVFSLCGREKKRLYLSYQNNPPVNAIKLRITSIPSTNPSTGSGNFSGRSLSSAEQREARIEGFVVPLDKLESRSAERVRLRQQFAANRHPSIRFRSAQPTQDAVNLWISPI